MKQAITQLMTDAQGCERGAVTKQAKALYAGKVAAYMIVLKMLEVRS